MRALWSNRCLVCRALLPDDFPVCVRCMHHLQAPENVCINCGIALPGDDATGALVCAHCLKNPPPFPQLTACCAWNEVVQILIHRLKYGRELVCARVFGHLFRQCMPDRGLPVEPLLIPVPLARQRQFRRGFNQAEEIARWCQNYGVGQLSDIGVRRKRNTMAQSQLRPEQRLANIRGCFQIKTPALPDQPGLVIVDDLVTTTSTAAELTRTLSAAGYRIDAIWCVARVSN